MLFRDLLKEKYVRVGFKATKKSDIFEELAKLFEEIHGVDKKEAYKAMVERERKGSTGLGNGLAVPHGRSSSIKKENFHILFVYEPEGINFEAYDKQPSFLFLAVLTSDEHSPQQQLEILRIIVEIYEKTDIVTAVKQIKTPKDLYELIISKEAECNK